MHSVLPPVAAFVLLFAFSCVTQAHAQDVDGEVVGRVTEAETGEPIASATVSLWTEPDSSLVTGTVTDSDGEFQLDGIQEGSYYLEVSFVGFFTETISDVSIVDGSPSVDVGTVSLASDTRMLDEVEVTGERQFMEVGVDRVVYNTQDQIVSLGGSASNVLENIPSVETDIDGNISLRGNQNVAVHINGRPTPMTGEALTTFLEGLPADIVERVEVIPNPSARYEPEGMAGILNIVLREDRDPGLTGGISLTLGTQQNYNASGNVSYQAGRVGLFASYGFRTGSRTREGWRFRENRSDQQIPFIDQDNFSNGDRLAHTLNANAEYELSRLNTISIGGILSHRTGSQTGLTQYELLNEARVPTDLYDRRNEGDRTDLNTDLRLTFSRILDRGEHEFTAEIQFENEREEDFEEYTQEVYLASGRADELFDEWETNLDDGRERELSLELDYMRPFGNEGRIEVGYQGDLERLDNEQFAQSFDDETGQWVPDLARNSAFVYDERIHSAYGILGTSIGRFGMQAGLRAERALINFDLRNTNEEHDNSYSSLFPSAFLTYEMTDARSVRLSYSKRVQRPRTWQLNPFDDNRDPLFRSIGNPALTPQYVHSVEASITQFTEALSLSLSPYYRRTVDVIRRIETVNDEGVSISTFENFDTRSSWGAEAVARVEFGELMNAYTSFNVYRVVTDGSNLDTDLSNDAYGFSTRTNATVNVAPGLDVQVSHYYRAPVETERGRIASRSSADVALRQQLFGNRASLSLRARDVFDQRNFHVLRNDALYFQESRSDWDARQISLTFRYNFGEAGRDSDRQRRDDDGPSDRDDGEMAE